MEISFPVKIKLPRKLKKKFKKGLIIHYTRMDTETMGLSTLVPQIYVYSEVVNFPSIMKDRKYIAYYRVSTQKQGESGLGLEAQVTMVKNFVKDESSILASYKEVESGKKDDRRELSRAIEQCKELGAVLLIAKLDRLSRNLTFISKLMDSGIKFISADMPDANDFTIHIFAALAQQERKFISERTIAALAEKKKQGFKLGKPENLQHKHKLKGVEIIAQAARSNPNRVKATGYINLLHKSGKSLSEIANTMNQEGFKTARGMQFSKATVSRFLK